MISRLKSQESLAHALNENDLMKLRLSEPPGAGRSCEEKQERQIVDSKQCFFVRIIDIYDLRAAL